MKAVRTLAIVLLAAAATITEARQPTAGPRSSGWGPSWVGGAPPGGNHRPQKLGKSVTAAAIADDGSELGVSVRLWADADVVKGNTYQLMYQIRVHSKRGEMGPILGTAEKPGGICNPICSASADDNWNGLEGMVDVNRKDVSGMTNLPADGLVALRIEPHLYDQTAGKFVTPGKTPAIIVMAAVSKNGRVESVVSLRKWIAANAQYNSDKILDTLAGLDEYDRFGNGIGEAIGKAVTVKEIAKAAKLKLIRAVPKDVIDAKSTYELWRALNDFAAGDDAELKAAAKAKLETR